MTKAVTRPGSAVAAPTAVVGAPRLSVRFVVCVVVLAGGAVGMRLAEAYWGQYLRKEPAPLRKPLERINVARLLPDYELFPDQPPPISEDTLQTLGTHDYVNLLLVDRRRQASDVTSLAHVFITFYTGKPDMVPHVPDECMVAGGFDQVGPADTRGLPIGGVGAPDGEVPLRVLQFASPGMAQFGEDKQLNTVMYFFHVNGRYETTRFGVREAQSNLSDRYAYYAKIELRFTDESTRRLADKESSVAAARDLLSRLLPVLLQEHLPDWEALNAAKPKA